MRAARWRRVCRSRACGPQRGPVGVDRRESKRRGMQEGGGMHVKSAWRTEARGVRARGCAAYRALAVLVAALGLLLALGAGNAFALSCSTTAAVTTVILNPGETVTMTVGAGDAITATGAGGSINCGGTTSTVDLIAVFGSDVGVADPRRGRRGARRDADHRQRCRRALRARPARRNRQPTGSTRSSGWSTSAMTSRRRCTATATRS